MKKRKSLVFTNTCVQVPKPKKKTKFSSGLSPLFFAEKNFFRETGSLERKPVFVTQSFSVSASEKKTSLFSSLSDSFSPRKQTKKKREKNFTEEKQAQFFPTFFSKPKYTWRSWQVHRKRKHFAKFLPTLSKIFYGG